MTIESFLTQLSEHCGVSSDSIGVSVVEDGEYLQVQLDLPEEETGRFIGFHGETLESLQRILRVVFQEGYPEKRITLNINSYREERVERLTEIVQSVAERVLETGETYTFQSFMPSHERYIIHSSLATIENGDKLESISEGEGKNRRLSIRLKQSGDSADVETAGVETVDEGEDSAESSTKKTAKKPTKKTAKKSASAKKSEPTHSADESGPLSEEPQDKEEIEGADL